MEVENLPREGFGAAARVMADAFMDDPGWQSVGPDRAPRLHGYIRRVCNGALKLAAWRGGQVWQVERDGGVAGVLSLLEPGQWPPPQLRATTIEALGPVLAGPRVLLRSLAADNLMHKGHPEEPHVFVSMLAVAPALQRRGVGRALLGKALAHAAELGVATYLDTANPANLPYYGSFGFAPSGQIELPRGAPLWFMLRP